MLHRTHHEYRHQSSSSGGILGRLLAPLQLGATELLPTVAKLYGALGVSSLRNSALTQLGKTLLKQSARYEVALTALCRGGIRTAENRLAVQVGLKHQSVLDLCHAMMGLGFLGLHQSVSAIMKAPAQITSHLCRSALTDDICWQCAKFAS